MQRHRLNTHVCKKVHGCLLHVEIGWRARDRVSSLQSPGPLHRAGSENQGSTQGSVQSQVMRGRAAPIGVVIQEIARHGQSGGRERDKTCWSESIIVIHIPLITKSSCWESSNLSGR